MAVTRSYYRERIQKPAIERAARELEQRAAVTRALQATCEHSRYDTDLVVTQAGYHRFLTRLALVCTGCRFPIATYESHPVEGLRELTNATDDPAVQSARLAGHAARDHERARLERERLAHEQRMARFRRRGIR